jgi:hypothetical protein
MIRAYISIPVYAVTGAGFCHLFGLFSYGVKDYLVLVGLAIIAGCLIDRRWG